MYFDKCYFAHENYKIGINKYKIIPMIFPKKVLNLQKLKDQMTYPLEIFKSKSRYNKEKKILEWLMRHLVLKLENWEKYKPIRGLIEDFFKAVKGAFGLDKFHSYTIK